MEEAKKNPPAKTTKKAETKPAPRITGEEYAKMKSALRRMPARRKNRSLGATIDDLSDDIFSRLREGRTIDEIYDVLAPYLHCNVDAFEKRLHKSFTNKTDAATAEMQWLDLISGNRPAIDTTATEIRSGDATPKSLSDGTDASVSDNRPAIDTTATEIQDVDVKPTAAPASARPAAVPAASSTATRPAR